MKNQQKSSWVNYISIFPSYAWLGSRNEAGNKRTKKQKENEENLKDNDHAGAISKKAEKKIRLAIDWLVLQSQNKKVWVKNDKEEVKVNLVFITLKLPSKQVHSDNEIKSKCLNQFLIELKKKKKVCNYVWRAEPEENGKIHFHLTTDKFIHYAEIQEIWTRIIQKLGYIDRYRENMLDWHKDGFRSREDLFKTWKLEKQLLAYEKGMADNWNAPHCTEIKGVRSLKGLANYLSKEFVKNKSKIQDFSLKEKGKKSKQKLTQSRFACFYLHEKAMLAHHQGGELQKVMKTDKIDLHYSLMPAKEVEEIVNVNRFEFFIERRAIEGRLWGFGGECGRARGVKIDLKPEHNDCISNHLKKNPNAIKDVYSTPNAFGQTLRLGGILKCRIGLFQSEDFKPFNNAVNEFILNLRKLRIIAKKSKEVETENIENKKIIKKEVKQMKLDIR